MRIRTVVLVSTMMAFTAPIFAQDTARWEIFGDYSYLQFNPSVTGLQSRAFNGGGGGVQYNFAKYFGIKADFQGYGSTSWTKTVTAPVVVTPHGVVETIPAGTFTSNGNMFTYLFGPTVGLHTSKFYVYGEVLFGGSNSNGYGNLERAINLGGGTLAVSGTQHPYTMAVGGGLDWNVSKHFAIRLADLDYMLTRYTNPLTQTNNQNNFRYVGGVVIKLGGKQ
jgi:outer membrane immunogenic protein